MYTQQNPTYQYLLTLVSPMKKSYLASAIALALGGLSFNASAVENCIGENPVVDEVLENVEKPTLKLLQPPAEMLEGDTILISALANVDTHNNAKAQFYWCADKGLLNALATASTTDDALANPGSTDLSTVDATANLDSIDFSSIEFTAPAVAEQGDNIRIEVKLSDGLGHSAYEILELKINDDGKTDAEDPAPVVLIDTPEPMIVGTENRISFFVSDENKEGDDNSANLSTDLYYRIDDGEFQALARNISGAVDGYTWTPDVAGDYQLKIVSNDGNKQAEALSSAFAVNDNDDLRKLLENIFITPEDDKGDPIIGGEIEIVINAEIVIIIDEDNDGRYEIPSAHEGEYEIKVRKEDRSYPTEVIRLEALPTDDPQDPDVSVKTEVRVTMAQAPVLDKVTVSPRDEQGEVIIGATIEIIIDGEIVIIEDEDGDGRYQIPKVSEGKHEVRIKKDDYVYPSTEVVVDADTTADTAIEPQIPPAFSFDNNDEINTDNLVVLGAYACDENSIHLVEPADGDLFHSFNADLEGRGIYINPVDFDRDGLTDIATGGINKGKDMLIYNTNREAIGKIISNGDDQGVLIAFGDVDADNDFEIMVTNQSADDTVNLYESDGKAVRALNVLNGKNRINIATGDVDGDGVDELIVVLADNAHDNDNNVFIFDENAKLMDNFKATPNPDTNTKGLTVTVGDVNGDGKAEIVVAESQAQTAYGVAVYDNKGNLQKRFNAFSGSDDGAQNPAASQCGNAYQGKGLLLSTGDVNSDNKADIIVARAGYRQVKLFDGEGEFIDWFNALPEGYQITALGFGGRMGVKLPLTKLEEINDEQAPLENITVIGQPDEPRPEITDREIRGTVRVANVLIVKITIKIGARLIVGPGTRFKQRKSIPKGQKLKPMCKKIKKAPKKKAYKNKVPKPIEVIDLNEPVVDKAPSVLEDIKVLVGDDVNNRRALTGFGLRRAGNINLTQDPDTGHLQARIGSTLVELMPVDMTQAAENAPASIVLESNGTGHFTTAQGQIVTVQAAIHDLDALIADFENYGTVERLETDTDGQLRLFYQHENNQLYRVGRPHFIAEAVSADRNLALGIYDASVLFPDVDFGAVFVFDDNQGVRRWQLILPTPADREALLTLAETDNRIDAVQLHFDDNPSTIPGTISFSIDGQSHLALFDYVVRRGALPQSGGIEFNPVDSARFEVTYPNGDRQYLYLIQ